ncbi:hypothetical protein GBAR_LOCUS19045 [Geodia barretti]|uniref:Uncharacterized protein n=1 Tax=Geodia barretti TaxID=519541 RepID=A0AA35SR68_GEOBA|nr:hypothetical protein GBAR_LOCUS19045 [Geodia barretti]
MRYTPTTPSRTPIVRNTRLHTTPMTMAVVLQTSSSSATIIRLSILLPPHIEEWYHSRGH